MTSPSGLSLTQPRKGYTGASRSQAIRGVSCQLESKYSSTDNGSVVTRHYLQISVGLCCEVCSIVGVIVMLAAMSPSHLRTTKTTVLMRPEALVEAMKKAANVEYAGPKK
jgi:hypothetical protein